MKLNHEKGLCLEVQKRHQQSFNLNKKKIYTEKTNMLDLDPQLYSEPQTKQC